MKRWLVLASYDEKGERQSKLDLGGPGRDPKLDVVTTFTSGDGEKPFDGDRDAALADWIVEGDYEFLFVPIDDTSYTLGVTVTPRVDVRWTGGTS